MPFLASLRWKRVSRRLGCQGVTRAVWISEGVGSMVGGGGSRSDSNSVGRRGEGQQWGPQGREGAPPQGYPRALLGTVHFLPTATRLLAKW